jgi:hypothetical protein
MHFGLKQFYFPFFIGSIVLSQPCSGYPSSQVRHLPRIFESHDPSKGNIKLVKGKRRQSDETFKLFMAKIDPHSSPHRVRPITEVNPTFLLSKPRSLLLLPLSLRHPILEMFPLVPCRLSLGNVQSSQMVLIHSFPTFVFNELPRFPPFFPLSIE